MALKKKFQTKQGVDAEYWKITGYNYLPTSGKYVIILCVFLNKQARDGLSLPFEHKEIFVDFQKANIADMYAYVKENAFFASAEDI